MSDTIQRIDSRRLGDVPTAEVYRYEDADILINECIQIESDGVIERPGNAIVLSQSQLQTFIDIVQDSSSPQSDPHVETITADTEWELGPDQLGSMAVFTRQMDPECSAESPDNKETQFCFTGDGEYTDHCQLSLPQAQDLYEYLVESGYNE